MQIKIAVLEYKCLEIESAYMYMLCVFIKHVPQTNQKGNSHFIIPITKITVNALYIWMLNLQNIAIKIHFYTRENITQAEGLLY